MEIFPKEVIENTSLVYQFEHSKKSQFIYCLILILLLGSIFSLPFLYVDVYTSCRGIIKPSEERINLSVVNSGRVIYTRLYPYLNVNKGDTLLILENQNLTEKQFFLKHQLEENEKSINDLFYLLHSENLSVNMLKFEKYQKVLSQYLEGLNELILKKNHINIDFERQKVLYEKQIISKSEFENKILDLEIAINALEQFKNRHKNTWQSELITAKNNKKELENNEISNIESQKQFIILAPISGTILNPLGIQNNMFLNSGIKLCEISPSTSLIVEVYVNPKDIGLINKESLITYQIDAFNYNQWGNLKGHILEIGNDIEVIDNKAVFKIRCSLNSTFLTLKNGTKGNIGKGMSLTAHFLLVERSLFNLLYDKMDDWMNPNQSYKNIKNEN